MQEKLEHLQKLMQTMDLPDWRKSHLTPHNLRWLARNLSIRNIDHPDYSLVKVGILQLLEKLNHKP